MRLMKHLVILILFCLSATPAFADKGVDPKISLDVKSFKLKNGMMFLVVERPAMPQVACRIAIRAGSALEDQGKTGLAHLLEHMMFKGTRNFGTRDIEKDEKLQVQIETAYQIVLKEAQKRDPDMKLIEAKKSEMNTLRAEVQKIYVPHAFSAQLEKNGAVGVNAFTSKDQTQYTASVPSDMLEQWFSIVSEQLFEPSWREFYVEREVIQREWAFRYVNNPQGAAWMDLYATAYNAHPYRNPTIGWKSDMEKLSTRDAIDFHQTHYNPTNAVCVLVGDIDLEQAKKLAGVYFERYPAGSPAPETVTREPVQQGPRENVRYLKGARTPLVRIGFHTAPMGSEAFYALDILSSVLSEGRSAKMTQNIIEKGLAVEAWGYNPDSRYGGLFILGGSPREPEIPKEHHVSEEEKREIYLKACEDLEQILLSQVNTLKNELITQRELSRVIKLNQRAFLDRMRSNEQLAGTLATLEVQVGWQYITGYLANLSAVTPEQVRHVAQKYFTAENKTSVYVIPGGRADQAPEEYHEIRSVDRPADVFQDTAGILTNKSKYPTPAHWKHPLSFERRPKKILYPEAENISIGKAAVFYLPDHDLPLIDLVLLVKAGSVDESDQKQGLSKLLNRSLVRGGTEKHPPSELAMILDENAIRLSVSVHAEQTAIVLSVMKDDWEKGLSLLQEILNAPGLDEEILEVSKQQAITALGRQGGDAMTVARRESSIRHFAGHPYGRDPLYALNTIPGITRNDLKSFMQQYFIPSNTTVALSGDMELSEAIPGLENLFKSLTKTSPPERSLKEPAETPPVLALVHKPGQVQSQVWITLPSVKRTHPDFWKISLLTNVLGGSGGIMYTRLRDDLGLIYSAGFFQTYKWEAGTLMGYIGCKGDKTARAIAETVHIMEKLKEQVPENLLEQKRLDVLNGFVFNVDTPAELAKTYATYHLRKEPLNTLDQIQETFINAKKEELEKLSEKYLDPNKLQIIVVGDKTTPVGNENDLEQDLKTLAEKIKIPYEEIPLR